MKKIGDYLEIDSLQAQTAVVSNDGKREKAVIRGFLKQTTPVKVLYMASLELDNMEMHESFRLSIEPGEELLALPEIAVINPIRSSDEKIGNYTLTLKIYAAGGVVHEFSTVVRF